MSIFILSDVNECDEKLDDCHRNATCNDSENFYVCSCKHGFVGDGKLHDQLLLNGLQ